MRKNEMGKVLKIFGIIVMVLGTVCSLVLGFSSAQSSSPMDDIMGYMVEPTLTYDFSQAILGIFASIVAGLVLMALSEIIYILDEKRENTRRLCARFGVQPAVMDNYTNNRRDVRHGHNGAPMNGNPGMNPGQGMNGNVNMGQNMNVNPNMNRGQEMNGNPAGSNGQQQNQQQNQQNQQDAVNEIHEDYGDE